MHGASNTMERKLVKTTARVNSTFLASYLYHGKLKMEKIIAINNV